MLIYLFPEYETCWLQPDGSFTWNSLKAEWGAASWRDYGAYLVPESFYDDYLS